MVIILCTGCPDTLRPPPQHNWAVPDPKPIYFLDPTSIPDLHARFQITNLIYLLPVSTFEMWKDASDFGTFVQDACKNRVAVDQWGLYWCTNMSDLELWLYNTGHTDYNIIYL